MRNVALRLRYDGSRYHGWQVQKNAVTVAQTLEEALSKVCEEPIRVTGCGRTDAGVHALCYCANFKTDSSIPIERFPLAVNTRLPDDIAVTGAIEVEESFNAITSCRKKEYIYKIWNSEVRNPFLDGYALHYRYKIDENLLNSAAQAYLGSHDFTSFCTQDSREPGDMTRTVKHFSVTRDGEMVTMKVEADGFLYNMVRIMVGTLLRVQQGKIKPDEIPSIIKKKDRSYAGPTAQACGLYLNKVNY